MVVCLQIVVLTFVYVWFENFNFFKLDTTCGEIMANLKRQKVELLIYTHGKLLQCPPDVIQWEDKSYFENSSRDLEMMADPSNLMLKFVWKCLPLIVPGKCSLSHWLYYSLFDPNNINYTFLSHRAPMPFWAWDWIPSSYALFWSRLRLEKYVG